ncbi:MAG TPA: hypothetical protein VMO20_03685, partial [Candidatus Acidoferrum sp.]|nr:hypothetical protein [Candidatus Acidoferrum sp.]
MPGIAGIIRPVRDPECPSLVNAMLAAMMHEHFYKTANCFVPEMNVYAGLVGFDSSTDGIFSDENIWLIFSGECFVGPELMTGERLIQLYKEQG